MLLNQDQVQVRDAVRAFAMQELWPHAARWDKEHTFPKDVHKGLAELGAYGICVPEEFGGANLDTLYVTSASVRFNEEALVSAPLSVALFSIRIPGVRGLPETTFAG